MWLRSRRRAGWEAGVSLCVWRKGEDTNSERTRRIPRRRPARAAIQSHPFIRHYSENPPPSEGFGIRLSFYFEHVEGEEDDFADADDAAGCGVHDGFAGAGAEGGVEGVAVVEGEVVAREGLAAVFVDSLEDLLGGLGSLVVGGFGGWGWTLYPAA